ncbi:mitochondrial splicing system protein [Beauveria asiatica]|uniref:Mitochondrial splicing system protein n=1 Tax=Beauveria asiatica TaxID=1069075 RepID=A0AAW0RGJ6_9HYPO
MSRGCLCPSKPAPKPRYATVRTLFHPSYRGASAVVLDSEALVLFFPAPATVTGEDVLELHVHGGAATVKAVLAAIPSCSSSLSGIRHAEPGEFTKRAFLHDRLDLAQVESLSDALAAETEQQRRAAVRGTSGALGRTYEAWRQQLLQARGELEALIDFAEDQHFDDSPADLLRSVRGQVEDMLHRIRLHERGSEKSELLRNGIKIALVGPPNAGKSSLMNLIVGREASIVSGEAGTTRDVVEASLDIRGYLCSFADTAGFRTREKGSEIGIVEEEGIRRARNKAREADVVAVLASVEGNSSGDVYIRYDEQTLQLAAEADSCLVLVNKRDSVDEETLQTLLSGFRRILHNKSGKLDGIRVHTVSCRDAQSLVVGNTDPGGVHGVIDALCDRFAFMTALPADQQDLLGVTERQRQLLADCRGYLEEFVLEASRGQHDDDDDDGLEADSVLAAEFLRYAADCLARITGRGEGGDVEEVLGVVFEKFCVGK